MVLVPAVKTLPAMAMSKEELNPPPASHTLQTFECCSKINVVIVSSHRGL